MPNKLPFNTSFTPFYVSPTENKLLSKTKQSFKDDCDINVLYKRFVKEQGYDPITDGPECMIDFSSPVHDLSQIKTLSDVFEIAGQADECFMRLPAEKREMFQNDPARFREAIERCNPQELQKYGLYDSRDVSERKGVVHSETQIKPQEVTANVQQDSTQNTQA